VAVITLDNPPVNGLGYDTRVGIAAGVDAAHGRRGGRGHRASPGPASAFSGGADIREFGSPKAVAEPNLLTADPAAGERRPSRWSRPSTRVCMGGGLELALGCHYRVAAPGAQRSRCPR
jgi:3-hydroxyacyl-CoA dehydrogenase